VRQYAQPPEICGILPLLKTAFSGEGESVNRGRQRSQSAEIEFGHLSEADLAGISDLITRMSSAEGDLRLRDKTPAYYRWMYLANPAGPANVHSARHRGAVVSTFAVAPKIVQIDGRMTLLGKTMDIFTDPAYQGQGLMKRCADAVFREAAASGMDGWYVTPSVNSYPIFAGKWGYREDFRVVYRALILDYSRVLAAAIKPSGLGRAVGAVADAVRRLVPRRPFRLPRGYEVRPMTIFGEEVDQLWNKVADGYRVALVRDADYLNWRYVENPDHYWALGLDHNGTLVGIIVITTTIRRGIRVGEIVDYVCAADDLATFRLLVRVAVADLKERGCALCQAWSIKGTRLDRRLRKAGLVLRRTDVKFLISPGFPDSAIYDPEAWLLTQGDGNDV
jgi:GNAT superfamily N-acetyltransferase